MHRDESVNGYIVGGDYGICWVTYEGRQQGPRMYPRNKLEALSLCENYITNVKKDCGEVFNLIYPNQAWVFHFDGI